MSNLSTRAMLCSVNISQWSATRTDKRISADVASQHNVSEKRAGHYRKHAIDIDAPSYQGLVKAAGKLRTVHYWHTLPWGQDGTRILTAANFTRYSDDIRHAREEFDAAVDAFVADYPRLCNNARVELNGMWNANDYPLAIASKFGVSVSIMPLPDASDFRANLAEGDIAVIKASIEEELKQTTALAMREPFERIHTHLSRMVERLSNPDHKFKDSIVDGLREICDIVPGLNLTGDANLTAIADQCRLLVTHIDPQTLRDKPLVRETVAKGAQEILDTMSAFMA